MQPTASSQDVSFAAAVETIVENCGPYARELLLAGKTPQAPKGMMQLSRTSDTRQRHRVEGVRDGRFHSVAPHFDDLVFDTVEFREVTSRLRRARGWFGLLPGQLKNRVEHSVRDESRRLAGLCSNAADALQTLVATGPQTQITVPTKLRRDVVFPTMKNRDVRGKAIGFVRRALRFTIKSVWEFPEMRERAIFPTDVEKHQTIQETNEIIAIAQDILRR